MVVGIHSGRSGRISENALRYVVEHTKEEYKIFALKDLSLETCDACLGCLAAHRCVKNDGINEIMDELCDASALVFAAPEYWDGVHGKARAFWERVCFMGRHNSAFLLKHLYGIIIGVAGVWDIFPQDTEILPEAVPDIANQDPHLCEQERRNNIHLRLEEAAKKLSSEVGCT